MRLRQPRTANASGNASRGTRASRTSTLSLIGTAAVVLSSVLPTGAYAADGVSTGPSADSAINAVNQTLAFVRAAALRTVRVTTTDALAAAVTQAKPGDRIALANGTYTLKSDIVLNKSGTAENPIVIAAENVGLAEIKGAGTFDIEASYLTVEGFKFTTSKTLTVPAKYHHIRISRNVFQLQANVLNWVSIAGDDCEVDHNTFQSKKTEGVFLQIIGPGSADMAKHTHIHHNYFKDHSFKGSNGGESIRLGLSTRQHGSAESLVEENLFENANGDPEVISVKSSDNVIRHNTIRNSRGTITLRHGAHNTVDGNLLIGSTTGIRIFGDDHLVINNVVQDSKKEGLIEIGGGELRDDTKSQNLHEAVDNVKVAFNTLVTAGTAPVLTVGSSGDKFVPLNVDLADNILVGPKNIVKIAQGSKLSWQANIFSTKSTVVPANGFTATDPKLSKASGLYRLTPVSPAVGAAGGNFDEVTVDMDGQPRPKQRSIGADEYVAGGSTDRAPGSATTVGPAST